MSEVRFIDNINKVTFNIVNDQTSKVEPLSLGNLANAGCLEGAGLAPLS